MDNEMNLIVWIVIMGIIILALLITVIRLAKIIIKQNDRVNAVDDYLLNKFLTNEREIQNGKTGESD